MKLHLPVRLRSAVLSCMAALATIGTTVITATMAGGAFSLVVSSSVSAETITVPVDDTSYADKTTTITGADSSFTVTGSGTPGTVYDYGEIVAKDGATVALTPYPTNASDSSKCVGKDAKLQIATSVTLENGSKLDCDDTSFYLKEPLTIVGSNTMNIYWSKSYDFESLAGNSDAVFNISLAAHDWSAYSLVRVLDTNATYQGKIALNNASNAQLALLGGGADTFSAASVSLGNNSKLLLGNEKVNVGSLEGSGRVELCPQSYVPTSEMVVPGSATLVVANGGGKVFSGSLGSGVSLNLSSGALTLSGLTVSDLSTIVADAGSTITLDGVTLSGQDMTLAGSGNYVLSGTVTIAGDFTDVTDGTVLLSKGTAAGLTLAEGATIKTSTAPTGYSSVVSLDSEGNLVINLTSATIDFNDAGTLYTNDMGVSMSYDADTKTYTGTYTNGDGQQTISRVFTEGNPVIIGAASAGVVPTDSMDLIVDSGTYDGLSFASVNGTTVGTAGSEDAPIKLNLEVNGSASVNNFIGGGSGLFGWTGASTSVKLYADISATINTTGSVGFLCLTGESNYSGTFKVYGDLVANVLNGTVNGDTGSGVTEPCAIAAGCKAVDIYGDVTYNIGQLGSSTGPTINGSIVGAMEQRNGGSAGSMTGDVTINLYGGTYNGNIYATGSKATVNGNYTVNYYGGTIKDGCKIGISSGGAVTGTKVLNICGNGVLDTTQFAYNDFDKVTIAAGATLNMVGDVTLGSVELVNSGTIDFSGVGSVSLDTTKLEGTETIEGDTILASYVVLKGGQYTGVDALGEGYVVDGDSLLYQASVKIGIWDANWHASGLIGAPETPTAVVEGSLTGASLDGGTVYGLSAANGKPSTIYQNTEEGYNSISLTEEAQAILGENAIVVGGAANTNTGGSDYASVQADSWIYVTGGSWLGLIGGNVCNNWGGGSAVNFTGDSHISVKSGTVGFIVGANYKDGAYADFNGSTYISVYDGASVTGSIIGGSVVAHQRSADVSGSTNVWIYTPLADTAVIDALSGIKNDPAVVGGSALLSNTANADATMEIGGSTNVHIALGEYSGDLTTFAKRVIGGSYVSGYYPVTQKGDSNVDIVASNDINFTKEVVGATFAYGNSTVTHEGDVNLNISGGTYSKIVSGGTFINAGTVKATHQGDVNVHITDGVFQEKILLGGYVANSQSSTIQGTSTLTIDGGSYAWQIVGGMYENTGTSSVISGDIVLNLNGGTYASDIIGGHYTTGNGTTAITASSTGDVSVNIGANAVVNGSIYGGTVLQRTAGQGNVLTQGNVSVSLQEGATINGNIYAAGGDYVTKAATSVLTTESTRVAIDNGVNLKEGIIISGGYIGMGNSKNSTVTQGRTLALTGTGSYDLSKVKLIDFDAVEVTNAQASVNMGVTLASVGITSKTGAGTYQLMEKDSAGDFVVSAGTLKLSAEATMTSLTVSKGATLDATSGAVTTDLTLGDGSTLLLGSSALSLGSDKKLTLGSDLTLDVTGVDASGDVSLVSGLASVMLGNTSMENGKWVSGAGYFSSVNLGGTEIANALLKLENGTLVVSDAKNVSLYWQGASNDAWSGQEWSATEGGADLGNFLSGTQVFFTANTEQEVVRVDQAATAYDITVNGDYRFDDAGGSLAVSNALVVSSTGKADFGVAVDLSAATVKVENGGELALTGETSIKDLQNAGATQVEGNLSIGTATSGAGSLGVKGDLTLAGDANSFGSLNVTGAVNSTGKISLTGAANTASSIGTLSGASITSTNAHKLTLTGPSSTIDNLSLAGGSNLTLASGATLTVSSVSGGGQLDVTLGDGLNGTSSQLTLGVLDKGTTINFTDATKTTFDNLFAGGASSVVLAQLTEGAQIEGTLLLGGNASISTSDGNLYKVVAGTDSIYVYYAHSGLIWDSEGDSWQTSAAWEGDTAAPSATDNVVFNGAGSETVVLGAGAVVNNVYIESEQGDKTYTFTGGDLTASGSIYVTSGALAIAEGTTVTAAGVEVTTGSLTVLGALDAGQMTAGAVTLDQDGSLTLGNGSDVGQILAGANAGETSLAVSDGSTAQVGTAGVYSVTVGDGSTLNAGTLTADGVSVGSGATLKADTLTLTGNSSSNAGSVVADTLALQTVGNNLGDLSTDHLVFSDIGTAGATDAVLTVSSIASVTSGQAIALDFSGLNVSRDGSYYLVSSAYGTDATFALTQEAVNYLSTLRFDARLETSADGSSVNLVLSTLGEMVWRTAQDTDETGSYTIPLNGKNPEIVMYKGLDPIQYVVVNGNKTLDYTGVDPSTATVSDLGAVVRNMTGTAGNTLTFVGDGMDADRVTFLNDVEATVGAQTIAGENITLQVGAAASDINALVTAGVLDAPSQNHALTVGEVSLTASRLDVVNAEGVSFTTGMLNGDEGSLIAGTIHINGAGGKYAGSGNNATIVLEQGAAQLFTNGSGITLTGSAGTAGVEGTTLGGLATTGADVVLVAPSEGESINPVELQTTSSMQGGTLTATVDEAKVMAGNGGDNAIFSGQSISLQGTQLVLNSSGSGQSMVSDVDLSKTDGFVITQIHVDGEELSSATGVSVAFNGGLLGKYFANATVQGDQIVASRNTSYYSGAAASSPNGSAGLALADGALVALNPQAGANSAAHPDLAGVLNSLDAAIAAGDRAGADRLGAIFAGAEAAGMGMAFSNDMDRQLRAIRNRTTTMGVSDEYVNPDMPYFNAWINAEGDYQQVKRDGTTPGYTLSSWGGTLGADVDFTPHFTAGLAVTAMYGDYQSESNGMAEGDLDSYYVTLFGRYSGNSAWVHTFVASVGMADASLKRTVTHANGSYTAEGDTTGMGFGLLYELGYTIALNEEATTCLQPVLNLSYVHTTLDGYRESGSDAALNFGNQTMDSFTVGLGARLQTLVGENIYNRTSMFESRALLKFTTGDRNSSMHTALASLPATQATVKSEEQGAIGVELGAGLSVPLGADSGTLFIDGSLEAYTSYTNVNATVGWRINF